MLRATFVMEQHLGHQTYFQNLHRFIEGNPAILPSWVPITYHEPNGVTESLHFLPMHLRGTLRGREQVRAGLRNTLSDVVFFNTQVPAALGGALVRRQPYVLATDLTPIQYDEISTLYGHTPDRAGLLKAYKNWINRTLFQKAAKLLPWSTWARDSLIRDYGVAPEQVEVLPPGVDLSLWRPAQITRKGPLQILFVGGDYERKGGPALLRAFQALSPGEAQLNIVTRSNLPDRPGVTVYNGMRPNTLELVTLYQKCDVFVLPTAAEAFGIAAVEACAAGLPVIAARIGGLVDIVQEGETGHLVQLDDEAELIQRLRTLASDGDLRARMGRAARERAEEKFDGQRNAARLVECLIEITERKDSRIGTGAEKMSA